jgi:PhnB protein
VTSDHTASIAPWISVPDATAAVEFYTRALGAEEREVLRDDGSGRVIVARLALGDADFWLQEDPGMADPVSGGRPIRMILSVADPDAAFERALRAGATEVHPVGEDNGWRVGRLADPFGDHWEIGRRL